MYPPEHVQLLLLLLLLLLFVLLLLCVVRCDFILGGIVTTVGGRDHPIETKYSTTDSAAGDVHVMRMCLRRILGHHHRVCRGVRDTRKTTTEKD